MDNTQQALQQARELAISMRHSAGTWMVPGWDGHRVADLLERIAALSLPVEAPSEGVKCHRCGGNGQWRHWGSTPMGRPIMEVDDCPACNGTGKHPRFVQQAEAELAEMRQHGDADDAVAAAINLERAHLAGGAPQSVREQAVAWACTDYDGHVGLGLTKEDAKRNAPEFCNEFFPLYASPLPAVQTVRMLTDGEVFDAATNWFDDGGSGTERAVRLVRDAIDKFCEVNGLALHQAHQKEDRDGL